jgi:hypothetical protein
MGFAAVTFVALTVRWGIHIGQDPLVWDKGRYMIRLVDFIIIALTIVVVAVPEVKYINLFLNAFYANVCLLI